MYDMKSFENQKHRQNQSSRAQSPCILHGNRKNVFSTLLISLLLPPVFLVNSCSKLPSGSPDALPGTVPARDSVLHTILVDYRQPLSSAATGHGTCLDIFIFDDTPQGAVDRIIHLDGNPEEISFYCFTGDKTIAAVANSPKRFNPMAIARISSLQNIVYSFDEDNPESPIMAGTTRLSGTLAGAAEIVLTPVMSEIRLESISNGLDGYELLEQPRIRLCNINGSAKPFQEGIYEPQELMEYGEWASLPYDVGMFPQEVSIPLYCYPNEGDPESMGTIRTMLQLECILKGKRQRFNFAVPGIPRASVTGCSIYVFSEEEADCEFSLIVSGEDA